MEEMLRLLFLIRSFVYTDPLQEKKDSHCSPSAHRVLYIRRSTIKPMKQAYYTSFTIEIEKKDLHTNDWIAIYFSCLFLLGFAWIFVSPPVVSFMEPALPDTHPLTATQIIAPGHVQIPVNAILIQDEKRGRSSMIVCQTGNQ